MVIDFVVCDVGTSMLIVILIGSLKKGKRSNSGKCKKKLLSDNREYKHGRECNYVILANNSR